MGFSKGRHPSKDSKAQECGVRGMLRACDALGWSVEHAAGTLAGHKYWATEFLTLNKLGNRKLLKVSHRNISMRAVH